MTPPDRPMAIPDLCADLRRRCDEAKARPRYGEFADKPEPPAKVTVDEPDLRRLLDAYDADRERLRLMDDAVDRYLELCRGDGTGLCDDGDHDDDLPIEQRPCLKHGYTCHWCQLDAARMGQDYETIESALRGEVEP